MATVLIPIPETDFDPTEVAVSWRILSDLGHEVVFATPSGRKGEGDLLMLTGRGLDPWACVPGLRRLVVVGRALGAKPDARVDYAEMLKSSEFASPLAWDDISLEKTDGVLLPGGHRARGMRAFLESDRLQQVVVEAFRRKLRVAAICHGVLLAARSIDPETGRSVLHGRRTTSLTWSLERRAWNVARISRFWDPDYYRTYLEQPGQPHGHMGVEQEVTRALARATDFCDVVPGTPDAKLKSSGRARDSREDERPAFVVRDGPYLSARWPGDVHTFAKRFSAMLAE
ncbi:MAG: type 1 glutamine amidotransferase domain-containing protein [Actinomycetota bacterium]|nr:type 1 glutamine amidotransferase domain-containing protein [Actinomycetota bacterium]